MNLETGNLNLFTEMFDNSVKYFARHVALVNDLNVFPVPDGDTGTNMYQTLLGMQTRVHGETPNNISEYCDLLAQAALYEGRGNSGVILSQIYRGIAEGVTGCDSVDSDVLLKAFTLARDFAYKSVIDPVEGTMLTVLTDLVDGLLEQKEKSISVCDSIKSLTTVAELSVDQTPEKLNVLKVGGVVDSGGYGLEIILRGMSLKFTDSDPSEEPIYERVPESSGEGVRNIISNHVLKNEEYGYCVQFVLDTDSDIDVQRNIFEKIAESIVIAENKNYFKIHLHLEEPEVAISAANDLGTISNVSIENMESQSQDKLNLPTNNDFILNHEIISTQISDTILIVVASGTGIRKLFLEAGAGVIIDGGDTLNPSVAQILDAVSAIKSELVLLLPNSKNVISAANEVSKLSNKNIIVLPTTSLTEGIECAMLFDPSITPEDNKEILIPLIEDMKTISIFPSSRNVVIESVDIAKGQYISMMDNTFMGTSNDSIDLLINSIKSIEESQREQVMILVGHSDNSLDVSIVEEKMSAVFGDLTSIGIEIHYGGQPNYDFLISILN